MSVQNIIFIEFFFVCFLSGVELWLVIMFQVSTSDSNKARTECVTRRNTNKFRLCVIPTVPALSTPPPPPPSSPPAHPVSWIFRYTCHTVISLQNNHHGPVCLLWIVSSRNSGFKGEMMIWHALDKARSLAVLPPFYKSYIIVTFLVNE